MMKDPRSRSPIEKVRGVHRSEWGHQDPYLSPTAYIPERRPMRPSHRSLSPPPERDMDGYRRGTSIERLEYNRRFYDDGRDDRSFSPSPPFGQSLKWSHSEDEYSFRDSRPPRDRDVLIEGEERYNLVEYKGSYGDGNPSLKHPSGSAPSNRDRSFFMPQAGGPVLSSGRSGGNFPSSSSSGKVILREEEERHFVNKLPSNTLSERGSYKDEDKPLGDVYDPVLVSSHSKDLRNLPTGVSRDSFLGFSRDGPHSYGVSRRHDKFSDFGGQDEYSEELPSDPGLYSNDPTSYHYERLSFGEREHREYKYHDHGRREEGNTGYQSELYREDQPDERVPYTSRDSLRPSLSRSVVEEVQYNESSRRNLRESNSRGHHSLHGEQLSNYHNTKSKILAAGRDGEFFGSGRNDFRMKLSSDRERTHTGGDFGFGRDAGPLSHKERLKRLQLYESDPNIYRRELSPKRKLKTEVLSLHEPTERLFKRRYPTDEEMSRHNDRPLSLTDRITSRQVQERGPSEDQWEDENPGGSFSSKRLRYDNFQHRKSVRPFEGRIDNRISASNDWSASHDIPGSMQRRPIHHYTSDDGNMEIKGRLRPCPPDYHSSYPIDKGQDFYKLGRTWKGNLDNQYDDMLTDDGNPLEEMDAPVKPDPPEDSDEFKKLIDNLFLQFSKRLNEKPSTQRRYREQGNAGSLLCLVCGRLSKEFLDTRSLVTHTFMSRKVGKRAQHLALNKAICVLMGWKSVVALNGACAYHVLPETEALILKEDLILWPPLVIIHNSSVLNNSPDGHQVITIEDMEAILRGLGFSGGKIKLRYGKPMNQSILLVKFLPTFIGLQEAEKLHNYFLENKRGRMEFQKLKYSNRSAAVSEESGGVSEKKLEHILHGYAGIAEDLDKLDFDTKRKSAVKSKKDIQAIADAPLKSE